MAKRFFCTAFGSLVVSALLPAVVGAQAPIYLSQWGTSGGGSGQFAYPAALATDAAGNVYVADMGGGQFDHPYCVATDAASNIYVVDMNGRVQKFTDTGTNITEWGALGSGNGQFRAPRGLATDAAGNVYVADSENHRVQEFTGNGAYVTQWGTLGGGNGQFQNPPGVGMGGSGIVYVADTLSNRVQVFGPGPTVANPITWGSMKTRYRDERGTARPAPQDR